MIGLLVNKETGEDVEGSSHGLIFFLLALQPIVGLYFAPL